MLRRYWIVLGCILGLATLLRFYNLAGYTEFRGDQGRAGLIALHSVRSMMVPLSGPQTLRGQYLGPFFYYFSIFFFAVGNFNPLVPAMATALLGVASVGLLFLILQKLVSRNIALGVSLLWAVSPAFVIQDQTLWEPNIVPFFSLLFVYAVVRILKDHDEKSWLLAGIATSILLQLHYFNIFFLSFTVLLVIWCLRNKQYNKGIDPKRTIRWALLGSICFLGILSPFILFEIQTHGKDISEILAIIFNNSSQSHTGIRLLVSNAFDYGGRIIGYFLPFGGNGMTRPRTIIFLLTSGGLCIFVLFHKEKPIQKIMIMGSMTWFVLGIVAMGAYRDVVYNHYLSFLVPAVILLIAYFLETLKKYLSSLIVWLVIVATIAIQLNTLFHRSPPTYDIERTQQLSTIVSSLVHNQPFAFTIYNSSSFSDLHYRFFFERSGIHPLPINGSNSTTLVVICDNSQTCTSAYPSEIPIMCYENNCQGNFGTVNLASWNWQQTQIIPYGTIFLFTHKKL